MTQLHDVVSALLGIHHEGDETVIPFWQGISHYSYIDWSYQSEQESCTYGTVSGSGSIQEQSLVTGKNVFHRIFWTFRQCCEAFKFAKLVIQIDGTHLYGKYKGKLLVATAQDGNDECLSIAFAIVEGETLDAWNYFLVNICAHVTDMSNICLISDRHRSIIYAVKNNPNWQPPNAYHVFCIRHIARNFNQKFRNEGLKWMLKNLGYTPTIVDFERNLASFRESSPQIAEWIDAIPKEKWSRAYDIEGRRYGHMTTNLAESVNKVLKGARNMPITALVKHTYSRLVAYFVERGTNVVAQLQSAHRHSKNVVELVKKNQVDATGHHVRWKRSYSVNLPQRFCQCGKFKAFKYPCSHVVAAALSVRQSAFTYVDDVFLTTNLVEAYSFPWEPIGNEEAIPEISGPKIIPDATMLRAKGRPKSTRIRNEMDEVETSQSRIRCGLCKERSHNRRGCPGRGRKD
ncbi:uncharacterized protein LOC133309621 [Gastrolobium bilobum]|uniref:uncharacterized protein LOC133309621 n=1 Tax=Gastrolobium bilobum TaxID=150636 RepID=UPI002AAFB681|nr:uncharacterized protein LOC133309621 [Gastrolobium bilobum]